jgi:hypothetical protein
MTLAGKASTRGLIWLYGVMFATAFAGCATPPGPAPQGQVEVIAAPAAATKASPTCSRSTRCARR